jgi:transcriptional antiterminator RfaH
MPNFNSGWYLLYTRPKQEKKVTEQLKEKQLKHYLPVQTVVRKWADRLKTVQQPLFPSYVFVYLEDLRDYFIGLNTDGVLQYVKFGGRITRVGEAIIHNLRLIIEYGREVEVSLSEFKQGQLLTISEGPFAGMNCEVMQYKRQERILVRFNLLRRNVLMELPAAQLIKN